MQVGGAAEVYSFLSVACHGYWFDVLVLALADLRHGLCQRLRTRGERGGCPGSLRSQSIASIAGVGLVAERPTRKQPLSMPETS